MPSRIGAELLDRLTSLLGSEGVGRDLPRRHAFAADAMPAAAGVPEMVLSPSRYDQVAPLIQLLHDAGIPYVPRGAGTGLSGGAAADEFEAVLSLARLRRIHRIDPVRRIAVVESGVVNIALSQAAAPWGLEFAPDPSSETVCTIGGNIAENASGPHTLKYGVTRAHLLALEMVLPDGRTMVFPSYADRLEDLLPYPPVDIPGPDLVSLMTGSEGTLGVVTRAIVRLSPTPEKTATLSGYFKSIDDAVDSVTKLLASGFLPAAVEMIDDVVLDMVSRTFSMPVPSAARAFLLVEVDGLAEAVAFEASRVEEIFQSSGALDSRRAQTPGERESLWAARKKTFGALGRVASNYFVHDGVVPRSRLAGVLREIKRFSAEYRLQTANIFHAGDGNVHPTILLDIENPDEVERSERLGEEILKLCVRAGGTITGEHGVGLEKRRLMKEIFTGAQMDLQKALRDLFNPKGLSNPRKIFPPDEDPPEEHPLDGPPPEEGAADFPRRSVEGAAGGSFQPETGAEVEQILDEAQRAGRRIRILGAGTIPLNDFIMDPSPESDLELDLTRLRGIRQVEPDDLTVELSCGSTLSDVTRALAPHNLWVPLDAPDPDRTTIGGILAVGYTGQRCGRWGPLRHRVLSLEVCVPGHGRQTWGRAVSKNVAGYDVAHMLVGSMGTLGVFTKAVLRAEPFPSVRRSAILCARWLILERLAGILLRSYLPWSHLDLVMAAGGGGSGNLEPEAVLLVGCEGSPEIHGRLCKELETIVKGTAGIEWRDTSSVEEDLRGRWGPLSSGA
ncbi:MAG: FAD-binding oxidoreductase, partial [Candidatus Eisenbacteria bacterium]|nr:FAD-binding oxidoreductase [Candidatus Eisenbacteria bacterium]